MIRRIVLIKFKEGTSQEQIDKYIETVKSFPRTIPLLRGFSRGLHLSDGDDSVAYSHVNIFDFDDMDTLKAFMVHPVHLAAVEGIIKDVVGSRVIINYQL